MDEIKTVASNNIKILGKPIISREILSGGVAKIRVDIKATVDTADLDATIKKSKDERQRAVSQYEDLQRRIRQLDEDIAALKKKIAALKAGESDEEISDEQERINREYLSAQKLKECELVDSGDHINELKIVNEAIKLNPRNGEAYGRRAWLKYFTETDAVALKDFSRALALDPENADYYRQRGSFYKIQAEWPSNKKEYYPLAVADYKMALKFCSENKLYSYERSLYYIAFATSDFNDVIETITQVIERYPQHSDSYANRAEAYKKIGDTKRANEDYAQAIKLTPETAKGYAHRAWIYKKMGNRAKAIEEYNRALKADEKLLNGVCGGLMDLYTPEEGVKVYTQLIKRYPKDCIPYTYRAWMYEKLEDYPRALEDYGKAAEIADKIDLKRNVYRNRAKIYVKMKDYDRAAEEYTKAINVAPTYKYSYTDRTEFYTDLKDYERAIEDYTNVINLNPDDPQGYMERAFFYKIKLKDYNHAIEDYTQAINLNPNITGAYSGRISCYESLKNYPRALEDYNRVIELEPNSPSG